MLEQAGQFAESEAEWRRYLIAHPQNAEANANIGLLEARQEHYKEAIPFYREAMTLDPRIPGVRLNLGLSYFKSGEMKQAVATLRSAQQRGKQPDASEDQTPQNRKFLEKIERSDASKPHPLAFSSKSGGGWAFVFTVHRILQLPGLPIPRIP